MHDRPTPLELIEAVREFLTHEVAPSCDNHRLKFRALVAINVLSVVERQLEAGDRDLDGTLARLTSLENVYGRGDVASDRHSDVDRRLRALCRAIRGGILDDDEAWRSVFAFALWHVESKLRVSNPRYLSRRAIELAEHNDQTSASRPDPTEATHGDAT